MGQAEMYQAIYEAAKGGALSMSTLRNQHADLNVNIEYGETLQRQGHTQKSEAAIHLAGEIRAEVYQFLDKNDADTASTNLNKLITDGHRTMGKDRKIKDILAHIIFALTGIGLVIILGKKLLSQSKSGFLNSTKRQTILGDIKKETHHVLKPKKH